MLIAADFGDELCGAAIEDSCSESDDAIDDAIDEARKWSGDDN